MVDGVHLAFQSRPWRFEGLFLGENDGKVDLVSSESCLLRVWH